MPHRDDDTRGGSGEVGKSESGHPSGHPSGLIIVRGGLYATRRMRARVRRASAREQWELQVQFERDMRAAYGRQYGEDGTVPSKGIYAIRDGSQHPWRVSWRRTTEANVAGVPLADVIEPHRVAMQYAAEQRRLLDGESEHPDRAA